MFMMTRLCALCALKNQLPSAILADTVYARLAGPTLSHPPSAIHQHLKSKKETTTTGVLLCSMSDAQVMRMPSATAQSNFLFSEKRCHKALRTLFKQ
jgi:hypothetical protein